MISHHNCTFVCCPYDAPFDLSCVVTTLCKQSKTRSLQRLMFVLSHENLNDAQSQMCCKQFITLLIVYQHCTASLILSAFNRCVSHLNENDANEWDGCVAGSTLGMNDYRMTSKHSNAFQYSVPCMFDIKCLI